MCLGIRGLSVTADIRTAAVEGRVIIEGEGLAGVTVTRTGGPGNDSYTKLTGDNGEYAFTELRPGDYQINISGYDPDDYEFASSSHDVSVNLGETEIVSFTGVLLRTSGISGRVSVEGMGIADIAVTLSGAAADTTMTDASGQYAFAGLAAGDYTVSIAVESAAYVFGSMSSDVTVGDDESKIANFEGAHATTASVSGMLFIDELMKNDSLDVGETALAQALVPVALVGPGVNDQRLSATDAQGQFLFSDLRAGPYQLIVPIGAQVAAALAANDLAYGGPPTGYGFALAVGETKTQAVPFDITHTTVNFTVSLKSGEETGDALPGATVTLYSDAAGTTKVGGGETGEDGSVAIKVARAGTTGNMVHAGVSADGYAVTDGMTAVSWNPQLPATVGANANDIVNLNVDVTVGGATITTEYGGGDALAGWAISVMMGDSAAADAPEALDDDGMAAFTTTVESVPASFTFAVDTIQKDTLDGGEAFTGTTSEYTHTGLSLAGTKDAGTMEVRYSTQTLKVYVHNERDQVMSYTGNVLGGDERDTGGLVEVSLRYIDDSGRSRSFTKAMWDAGENTGGPSKGVWTFSHVPASANVIATADADEDEDGIMLLDPDELAAFRNLEDNGVTGGAFGDMGGFSHTVSLCPLQATSPQDHDECSSFAFVSTYAVSGLVWKSSVAMDDGDEFKTTDPDVVAGITVSLTPVEGKNLAGDEESYTTAEKKTDRKTEDLDETLEFDFGSIASGAYEISVPSGWRARTPAAADDLGDDSPKGATGMVGDALNPLGRYDADVELDITPATGTVYGFVISSDGFALDSVAVTANGVSTLTDEYGRYILEGFGPQTRKIGSTTHKNSVFVEAVIAGIGKDSDILEFKDVVNNPTQVDDLGLSAAAETASISGTVRASGSAAPVAGAKVEVSYYDDDGNAGSPGAPINKNAKSKGATKNDIHLTGADGTYTVMVKAQEEAGESVAISVSKDGMSFAPESIDAPAHSGATISGIDFTGFVNARITGRVVRPGGGPMSGVTVTATPRGEDAAETDPNDVTGRTGTFSISVPFGRYIVSATADGITRFTYPDDDQDVNVAPGQSASFGSITGESVGARDVEAARRKNAETSNYDGMVLITMAFDTVAGFTAEERRAEVSIDGRKTWLTPVVDIDDVMVDGVTIPGSGSFVVPTEAGDSDFQIRILTTAMETVPDPTDEAQMIEEARADTSSVAPVGAVNSTPSKATAVRSVNDQDNTDATDDTDILTVGWTASSNAQTNQRVLVEVEVAEGRSEWLVADGAAAEATTREWVLTITGFEATTWPRADGTGTSNVTSAALLKALKVSVETSQGDQGVVGADDYVDDDDYWTASNTVSVKAKPTT